MPGLTSCAWPSAALASRLASTVVFLDDTPGSSVMLAVSTTAASRPSTENLVSLPKRTPNTDWASVAPKELPFLSTDSSSWLTVPRML